MDFHGDGFACLGAACPAEDPERFSGVLMGAKLRLPYPSVGATENLLMAALGASGITEIHNAAREPEIICLCDFLRKGGADISGDGTAVIRISGGLPGCAEHRVIPDRMEAATFACAVASSGGRVRLNRADRENLVPVLDGLEGAGCRILRGPAHIEIEAGALKSPGMISTGPYPGFPTDAQAPFMAAMLRARGETTIRETVFDRRMGHVDGLCALGGKIRLEGDTARITGVDELHGAAVKATDLRGGAALAVAALAARGETLLTGAEHILRGYERFAQKLRTLGGDIRPA